MTSAQDFVADLRRFEGSVPWMYLDVKGLVTVGVGNMLPSAKAAMDLPFQLGAEPAFSHEVYEDYGRVARMKPGLAARAYKGSAGVALRDEDIDRLLIRRLEDEFIPGVTKLLPNFDHMPAAVRAALIDMAFNLGVGGLAKFPTMLAYCRAGDWTGAALECRRSTCRPERNAWTADKFRSAVKLVS